MPESRQTTAEEDKATLRGLCLRDEIVRWTVASALSAWFEQQGTEISMERIHALIHSCILAVDASVFDEAIDEMKVLRQGY